MQQAPPSASARFFEPSDTLDAYVDVYWLLWVVDDMAAAAGDCIPGDLETSAIPLSLFVIMCALAALGMAYAAAIMVFNIARSKNK